MKVKGYSAQTHQGPYFEVNEDTLDIDILNNLYMIFDGFGGAQIGDKAANLVKDGIKKFYTKVCEDEDSTLPFYFSHKYLIEGNALINSMHYAHALLKKDNQDKALSNRGGASGLCVGLSDHIATIASCGNCKAYIFREGHLITLISPDSMSLLGVDDYVSPLQTAPMSAFGLFDDLHLQIKEFRMKKGDILLMVTDGSYSRLDDEEIKFILNKKTSNDSEKISHLFELCNSRGNLDNQSAIILQF